MPRTTFFAILLTVLGSAIALEAQETGLIGTYYSNADFTGISATRTDLTLDFSTDEAPAPGIGREFWSAIWTGSLAIPADGVYTFTTRSDDGVQLIIDGIEVIRNWTGHAPTDDVATLFLAKGDHRIEVRYYNGHEAGTLQLSWQSPLIEKEIIPTTAFAPLVPPAYLGTGTGLLGTYYADTRFTRSGFSRVDAGIDFEWATNGPGAGISGEAFSSEWRGWVEPQYSQTYTFYADADDCLSLDIDDHHVLGSLEARDPNVSTGSRHLVAGQRYEIVVRYRQVGGTARARLSWSCALTQKQIIPTSQLYPSDPTAVAELHLVSPGVTYVSPGWCEVVTTTGRARITGTVGGQALIATREDHERWFLGNAPGSNPGIVLTPGVTSVAITSTVGSTTASLTETITWSTYDLANPPYAAGEVFGLRRGDTFLVTARAPGAALTLTCAAADGSGTARTFSGTPGDPFQIAFTEAGSFLLNATIDGVPSGSLRVDAVGCDLRAPIACEVAFQRNKSITLVGPKQSPTVWIGPSDPGNLEASVSGDDGTSTTLHIRTLGLVPAQLQARIGGKDGPLISSATVDPFIMRVDSETSMDVIETLPDGTLLTQGRLTMFPLVPSLEVKLEIFSGGAQFINGTLLLDAVTSAFTPANGNGIFLYQIICSPQLGSALCHHTSTYQGSDLIGRH